MTTSIDDVRKRNKLFLHVLASFGSANRLQNLSNLSMKKVKMYVETKSCFTEKRSRRLGFPRIEVVFDDINEIWSVDLAYVDKLAKYNPGVKYLLVTVDCLSRYLRFEPLKTVYTTETSQAFKNMSKPKQLYNVWVDDDTDFVGAFKTLCTEHGIHSYSTFGEKKSASAERK